MPTAVVPTLATLRQAFYDLFDENPTTAGQGYLSTTEANRYINGGASHLYNWLISCGEEYVWQEMVGGFTQGTTDFALPADFMKCMKVFLLPGYLPLPRLMPEEWRGPSGPYVHPGYLLMGNYLRIAGVTSASAQVSLWYVPVFTPMVADTDTFNIPYIPGWAEYVVNHAVIRAKQKEESDTTDLKESQQQLKQMIEADMQNRDMGRKRRVVDVQGRWL